MGGSSLGLMEILCREWTGQIDRTGLPAQPRSDPTDGQNGALPWRQSLGQAGSGRQSHRLLSGRTQVAAQPTASSMETARLLSHKVPQLSTALSPMHWPRRRVCVLELRV